MLILKKLWISQGDTHKLFVRASQGECCVEMSWLWVTYFRSYGHLKKGALCPQTLWFLKNFSGLNIRTKFKCLDWHKGPYLPRQQVSDWHPVQTHILIFGDQSSFSSLNFQMSFWQPFEIWLRSNVGHINASIVGIKHFFEVLSFLCIY